jgi:putative tryptophan/tyrosine transport system substrate-binding protein
MRRREFIGLLGGAAAWPLAARAQQADRVRRVGALLGSDQGDSDANNRLAAFAQRLAELGWNDGRNLRLDVRWGAGDAERMRRFAKELVDLRPDAIFTSSGAATRATQRETQTIPIIFSAVGDPTAGGLLENVAKPEGNTTGATNYIPSFFGKWLELLKEAVPRVSRVGLVFNPDLAVRPNYFEAIEGAASHLSVMLTRIPYRDAADLVRAIDAFGRDPNGSLIILPPLPTSTNRALINRLALEHALPTMFPDATAGGVLAYGPDFQEIYREGASYVDRVLRGAKVAELPVQFPTKFKLVVNLKIAKAIGLTIPEGFLLRADELIE